MRDVVLDLSRRSSNAHLFPGGVEERAATAAELAAGDWQEAWLTCSSRKVAPLARIWRPGADHGDGCWTELPGRARGSAMRELLEAELQRESEPIA